MRILVAASYVCSRAGGSLGLFDVIAIGPHDVRLVQVKCGGAYLSSSGKAETYPKNPNHYIVTGEKQTVKVTRPRSRR